jgi:acetone carboxylase gamma subunit
MEYWSSDLDEYNNITYKEYVCPKCGHDVKIKEGGGSG